jgi:integrase
LKAFAKAHGLRFLGELDLPTLRKFYAGWTQGANTAKKKDERVKSFFRHAFESKWIDENPARRIKGPKVKQRPTLPFSREEMLSILEACEPTSEQKPRMRAYLARMRAFVLLLRYSGLRLGDAARLPKDRISGNASSCFKLLLYTQKTGVPVHVPLPAFVVLFLERNL